MAFRFTLGETFLTGVPRIARERISSAVKLLSQKPRASPESIHEARKSLKSLRAVLRLARGGIRSELRTRESLFFRDAGRSLSAAREPQALLEALDRIAKSHRSKTQLSPPEQSPMRGLVAEIRREINQQLTDQLGREPLQVLVKELQSAKRRTASWFQGILLRPGNEWEMLVGTGLRQTYRKARNLVWQIETSGHKTADDEPWHELRKCAKALGYQLQLLKPIRPATLGTLIDEIDQLTSRLGDANDLAVLQKRVREKPSSNRDADRSTRQDLTCSIERRKQKLRFQALKYARAIYSERPGQFDRRLAGYWRIWRGKRPAPALEKIENGASGEPLNEAKRNDTNPELLPVASLSHPIHCRL
jgi:CHAD domain-containing protein